MKYSFFSFVGTLSEEANLSLEKGKNDSVSLSDNDQGSLDELTTRAPLPIDSNQGALPQEECQNREKVSIEGYKTIAQVVYLSGKIVAPPLCSGMSLCGRCRVRIRHKIPSPHEADSTFFTAEEIEQGWRLGCRHTPVEGMLVDVPLSTPPRKRKKTIAPSRSLEGTLEEKTLGSEGACPPKSRVQTDSSQVSNQEQSNSATSEVSLAVDLGTTSLHWMFIPPEKQETFSSTSNNTCKVSVTPQALLPPLSAPATEPLPAGGSVTNPQMGAGSDVISRLAVARTSSGRARLSTLVVQQIEDIMEDAEDEGFAVTKICLAANPAMTAIALDRDVSGLVAAPYSLPLEGGSWERVSSLPPLWIPPQLSPFVGGDISAGYAAIALASSQEKAHLAHRMLPDLLEEVTFPFLLADMGTNGEFVLALSPEKAFTASVALGPALEGIGLLCGTEARHGAVTAFDISPLGLQTTIYTSASQPEKSGEPYEEASKGDRDSVDSTSSKLGMGIASIPGLGGRNLLAPQNSAIGEDIVCGITGTGYLSLLRRLLVAGAISREGRFTGTGMLSRYFSQMKQKVEISTAGGDSSLRKGRTLPPRCLKGEEPYLPLPHKLFITATDVEEILKVKAAFSLGLTRLLATAGVSFSDLTSVYLAGALGEHIDTIALEDTGFLPKGAGSRVRVAGNTSLLGSALLLGNEALRAKLSTWATTTISLDLAQDALFLEQFSQHMTFRWNV